MESNNILYSIYFTVIFLFIVSCTTVPVTVNMPKDDQALNLTSSIDKFPYSVGLLISDSFSEFSIKEHAGNANIDYDFQYDIGNDLSETLPAFLSNRFDHVEVLQQVNDTNQFNYIIIPDVSLSRFSVNFNNITPTKPTPTYSLEINLQIETKKGGISLDSIRVKEAISSQTEVGCWTCWGEKVLNQQKIRDEYSLLLSKVYSKLDSNLIKLFEETKNAK